MKAAPATIAAIAAIGVTGCLVAAGCDLAATAPFDARRVSHSDAERGRMLVAGGAYGCAACHAIPGILSPRGVVGPPLDGMARRSLIAGQLPNKPGVLVAFLQNPPALLPRTGMPDVGLGRDDARDIAAFLYTLEPSNAP